MTGTRRPPTDVNPAPTNNRQEERDDRRATPPVRRTRLHGSPQRPAHRSTPGATAGRVPRRPHGGPRAPKPPEAPPPVRNWTFGVLGALVLLPLLAFVVGWMIFKVPAIGDQGIVQTATYTFAGGEPIAVVRPKDSNDNNINRNIVTIDKVPAHVRQAVLAAEDRSFYSNPGLRPGRHRARGLQPAHRRCRRRLHDHAAVREGLHRPGPGLTVAQVQGDHPLDQDLQGADEGPDPRELPQHRLLRPRRLRHPGRGAGVLPQGRRPARRSPRARCSPG